ncbi:Acetyl-CoA acetyltransferase [Rhodococcus wratislaviensis]|uniref:Probable acetyl-CoA acetyltransferase n=1 Tax=Rhodococcus wratislaviensis TaxID=44752 RepID=A0A402BZU3_RHOWR|nr:acetyl-CoA C-acetyltransferase [Rhodococcus wratislaviensis]GCE36857.1 Acetyl-CoA acetyltransferase [Rhodococcus wratislaviensis]
MRRAAIVAPSRTAIGAFGGGLKNVAVEELGAAVAAAVVERSGIDPARIEDMVFAQSYANSETPCVGRWIALQAGFPIDVAGMQLDRRCGGGLQSIAIAAMMVQSGAADVVMAGGVESMSNVEFYTTDMRRGSRQGTVALHDRLDRGRERSQPVERFGYISGMIETAENLAARYGISRESADAFAVQSHHRAAAAWSEGRFTDEVVPIEVPQRRAEPVIFDRDEGVRADSSVEKLTKLRTVMPKGTVTAGNACQQNDAAAACLVVAEDQLGRLGLDPLGFLHGWAAVGCDPAEMGIGPVPAVRKLFGKLGLGFDDMDLIEVNEAFAVQVLAVLRGFGYEDQSKVNVNGSGISLGHPVGATGSRIMTTLLHELKRRGGRYGLETMCIGGGQGIAAVFESA